MRFEIAQSLNGDKIIFIARDTGGVVRLREESLEKLEEAIKNYNEQLAADVLAKPKSKGKGKDKGKGVSVEGEESTGETPKEEETQSVESPKPLQQPQFDGGTKKKFLHNGLKEKIEEKKKTSTKKSFWDKLK